MIDERPIAAIDRADDAYSANTRGVFSNWMIVFGLVGAQMAWILRPFVGAPTMAFE